MDEQAADTQRVLWAVVAVSLLVIVVLSGGLYFLRPQGAKETDITVTYADESSFDPFEHVRSDQEAPGLLETTEPVRQVTLVVGDPEPQPTTPAPSEAPAQRIRQTPSSPSSVTPVSARVTKALAPSPAPQRSAILTLATEPTPVSRDTSELHYWIQIGAFSSRSRADDLHKLVRNLGYAGRVTPHDTDGVTMHRVRIGPYASRPEANQLLGKLRISNDMDGWIAQVRG